jgi:hypothetical protein
MSYSRWSSSKWYSFYNSSSEGAKKEEQVLSLWHVSDSKDFTYKELKDFGQNKLWSLYPEADNEDILEALSIIERFIHDVDEDFSVDDLK